MVRKLICVLLFIILLVSFIQGQNIAFEYTLNYSETGVTPREFIQNQDGLLIGPVLYSEYEGDTIRKLFPRLFTFDENGDTASISFQKLDTLFDIQSITEIKIEPFGYLLWGKYYPTQAFSTDVIEVLIRTDYEYNTLWEKHFDFGYNYVATCREVLQTKYSELLLACNPDDFNMYMYKLSNDGDSLDFKHYGEDSAGSIQSLTYNFDSTAFLLHTNRSHWQPGVALNRMIEIDSLLNQVDVLKYPDWYDMSFRTVLWEGNKFLSCGDEWTANSNEVKRYFAAYLLNDSLETLKTVQLTNPDTNSTSAWWRNMDTVGKFVYLGGSFDGDYHSSNDTSWYYVAMLNEDLDLVYEKYIGGDKHYWCECITATDDGGVFLSGACFDIDSTSQYHDAYFVKLDTIGLPLTSSWDFNRRIADATLYPNPGSYSLNVRTNLKGVWIWLYDINGKLMLSRELCNNITRLNTSYLPAGTYIYSIVSKDQIVQSGKWIKKQKQ